MSVFKESSRYSSESDSPGFLLWRVSTCWRRLIEGVLKPLGLTHPQFVLLASIGWLTREGIPTTQAAVGRHADLDPNTVSQVLRGLETKGFIERLAELDERSKNPRLTKKGSALLREALPAVEQADEAFFRAVPKDQALQLLRALAGSL